LPKENNIFFHRKSEGHGSRQTSLQKDNELNLLKIFSLFSYFFMLLGFYIVLVGFC